MQDENTDILFITETWLMAKGNEVKCVNLCITGYSTKSFPQCTCGGGLAVVYYSALQCNISVVTDFDFEHTTFELIHFTLSVSQHTIHIRCLYHPPQNKNSRLTESMFFDQFPDLLEFCNRVKGSLLILGDLNIHFDQKDSPATIKMNDLL